MELLAYCNVSDNLQARKRFFPSTKVLGSWSVISYPQERRRVKIAILHNKFLSKSFRFPVNAFSVATILAATGDLGQQDGRPASGNSLKSWDWHRKMSKLASKVTLLHQLTTGWGIPQSGHYSCKDLHTISNPHTVSLIQKTLILTETFSQLMWQTFDSGIINSLVHMSRVSLNPSSYDRSTYLGHVGVRQPKALERNQYRVLFFFKYSVYF